MSKANKMECGSQTCDCCGGSLPARDIWEANRDHADDCTGSVDSNGRCRAFSRDELWQVESDETEITAAQGETEDANLEDTTMSSKHIEVWYDETSDADEPLYCVSLCAADGEEIRCLSTHEEREAAEEAGRKAAEKRGLTAMYRDKHGVTAAL